MTAHQDLEKRLDEIQDMVDENRVLLKKINRRLAWGQAMKAFYWLLIIVFTIAGYYAVQPYFQQATSAYGEIQGGLDSINGLFQKAEE